MNTTTTEVVAVNAAAAPRPQRNVLQGVSFVPQQGANLCWAACGTMILNKIVGANLTLIDVVREIQGQACIVEEISISLDPKHCDYVRDMEHVYTHYHKTMGYNCVPGYISDDPNNPSQPSQYVVPMFIDRGQPIQLRWRWKGGEGHTVLIVGYDQGNQFLIYDPLQTADDANNNWRRYDEIIYPKEGYGHCEGWLTNFGV